MRQRAKKVVSDSPGLLGFAIGLVNSVFKLPDGQVMFFEEFAGAIHSTKIQTGPTGKRGPPQKVDLFFPKLFRLDRTDPLSFGPKFPEILVEWIAPRITEEL